MHTNNNREWTRIVPMERCLAGEADRSIERAEANPRVKSFAPPLPSVLPNKAQSVGRLELLLGAALRE
jgi:hypothetical protein